MADDIERAAPPQAVAWPRAGHSSTHGTPNHGGGRDPYAQTQRLIGAERGEASSIARLAAIDLGPEAHAVVMGLVEEIERLRVDLEQATARNGFLETLADQHAYLPALNRRALLRAVGNFLLRQETTAVPGCLVLFYLANFEGLHRHHGLRAAEAALMHLSRQVAGAVRASDTVGSVGGAGLAVLMPMADEAGAQAKAASLVAAVEGRPLHREGGVILTLSVLHAVRPLAVGDTADAVLDEADSLIRPGLWAVEED